MVNGIGEIFKLLDQLNSRNIMLTRTGEYFAEASP